MPALQERHGWCAWSLLFVVICVLIAVQPGRREVTAAYFPTAEMWWQGEQDIYTPGFLGFPYLPQSVLLFTPFTWLPDPLDKMLWRLLGLALFACSLWRLARLGGRDPGRSFAWSTLLVMPALFSSARNGQANLHLIGLMLHAGADLAVRRWWRATVLLWLGMAAKPLAVVMLLLAAALYRPMTWRLALGLVAFAALPYLHADAGYVTRQYGLALEKLARSADPTGRTHADLLGALAWLGLDLPTALRLGLRAAAALVTLGLCWSALRRGGPRQGAWLLTAFAACYLVLFNGRTETNSYVIVVAFPALLAAWAGLQRRGAWAVGALVLLCLALGCDNYGRSFHALTSPWLKPFATVPFALWLALRQHALRRRPLLPEAVATR